MSTPAVQLRERVPRLADAAIDRARLTVVPRRRVRAARMPFVTLVSLVLLGGVVGLLCFNTQMQQASFAATSLETQADNLTAREQTLHDELQALRDPQNLATRAQQELGMVVPQSSCTVRLAAGTTENGCTPATADNTPPLHGRPPKKPDAVNPDPVVVTVPPTTGTGQGQGGKHHGGRHQGQKNHHGQARDTARG
jgi:cell division protein FtsB